ncbi:MAG: VapC toxin family PIN domain ribonuclease, partial [Deltaproteobacteria bacterium]|nr:VapC toxin family PIN domain ribonuclease [Deltaproteobacteria bacterium]
MILVVDASAAVEYLLQTAIGLRVAGILETSELAAP